MTATSNPVGCACPTQPGAARSRIVQQFAHPTGWLGHVAGHLMAIKNRARGQWVISLLQIQPADRVLEVGFGPGADLRRVSLAARTGFVAGIDHSEAMLRQASRRNASAVRQGRVALHHAAADQIPYRDGDFDLVYSINCAQFWENAAAALAEQRRVLREGGRIAVAVQPRWRGADAAAGAATGGWLVDALERAGFREVRLELMPQKPAPAACALGLK